MSNPQPRCLTCRWWCKEWRDDDIRGECRINPPTFNPAMPHKYPGQDHTWGHWPVTYEDAWCSEHDKKYTP